MSDYYLRMDDFKKEKYVEYKENVWIHPNLDINKMMNIPVYRYEKSSYFFQQIRFNKLHFSNRLLFSDKREWGYKEDKRLWFPLMPAKKKEIKGNSDNEITRLFFASLSSVCLSCWTLDEGTGVSENIVLWKYFDADIRIKTTLGKLITNISSPQTIVLFSKVNYTPEQIFNSPQQNIFSKTLYYKDEREIRLCVLQRIPHFYVDFNFDESLEEILISPFLEEENKSRIKILMQSGFGNIIKKSSIIEI